MIRLPQQEKTSGYHPDDKIYKGGFMKLRVSAIAQGFFHTDVTAYIDKPEFKSTRRYSS